MFVNKATVSTPTVIFQIYSHDCYFVRPCMTTIFGKTPAKLLLGKTSDLGKTRKNSQI